MLDDLTLGTTKLWHAKLFVPLTFTSADKNYLKKNHRELMRSALEAEAAFKMLLQEALRLRDLETSLCTRKGYGAIFMFSF